MITRVTKSNSEKYRLLFESASNALGANNDTSLYITNLNQYFQKLPDIIKSANFRPEYVILPADEDLFEINANTREITIPATFKKSVAVEGDQVAEIIYFVIDRYFDTMDLNNQNIYIEWTSPKDMGISTEFIRDIQSQKDKIIFGWALDQKITKDAGTIEFAVRFYTIAKDETGADTIEYSLSTLPAKIHISKGMNMDILSNDIDIFTKEEQQFIFDRIMASVADEGSSAVEKPEILEERLFDRVIDANSPIARRLVSDPEGKYTIYVSGYSTDTGKLFYYGLQYNNQLDKFDRNSTPLQEVYLKTLDKDIDPKTVYYFYDSEAEDYIIIPHEEMDMSKRDLYFEKFAAYELPGIGTYQIEIENKVGISTDRTYTDNIEVPGPINVTEDLVLPEYYSRILEIDEEGVTIPLTLSIDETSLKENPGSTTLYEWSSENENSFNISEDTKSITVEQEDNYKLILKNKLNGATASNELHPYKFRVTYHAQPLTADNYTINTTLPRPGESINITISLGDLPSDDVFIEWFKENTEGIYETVQEPMIIQNNFTSYTPLESGRYKAELINHLNGDEARLEITNIVVV